MRLTTSVACFIGAASFWSVYLDASADQLSNQIQSAQAEKRGYLVSEEAKLRGTTDQGLKNITDEKQRLSVANELAVKRALDDMKKNNIVAAAPSFRKRIIEQASSGNPDGPTKTMLGFISPAYAANNETVQMFNPFGKVSDGGPKGSGGNVTPIAPTPQPDPNSLQELAKTANTSNKIPDLNHLPFSMNFLVEIRSGPSGRYHCSGSLLSALLVLTARHCLYNPDTGERFSENQIQVRVVSGGTVFHGVNGSAWTPKIPDSQSSFTSDADIATFRLDHSVPGNIDFGRVSLAGSEQNLWVVMAGVGVTDRSNIKLDDWNAGYISWPQLVEFGSFNSPTDPTKAVIPWIDQNAYASAQCAGDSGGPVFVVGAHAPLIVGVLSASMNGNPDISSRCLANTAGAFVNLAHPFVEAQVCDQLKTAGTPCSASIVLTQGTSPSNISFLNLASNQWKLPAETIKSWRRTMNISSHPS